MSRPPLTSTGADDLRDELHHCKTVKRPAVIQAIAEARAHGDLKENAEYHAAKEQQSFIEGRIAAIEDVLSRAQIIEVAALDAGGRVVFGATVELVNIDTDEEVVYQVVGDMEADIKAHRISISSPIARALIGKSEGDTATVHAPSGEKTYEILEVKYL